MKPRIQYPIADNGDGFAVSIQDATSGVSYRCFGCREPMVARRGAKRAWHFAHKPPLGECADPDGALHEAAKALIVQGFTAAQASSGEYRVGFACKRCGKVVSGNIARPNRSIAVEQTVVENTRSDIAVYRLPEKAPLLIEVVVSHEIELATKQRYEAFGLPVFVVYPEWSTITELAHGVLARDVINVPPLCAVCREEAEHRQRELSEAAAWAKSMLRDLPTTSVPTGSPTPNIRRWSHDKFGRPMYPQIRGAVQQNAVILRHMGFVQSKTKPWLFMLRLPDGAGVVYANFGSTNEVAIWEDTSALIHWQLEGRSVAEKEALVRRLLRRCRWMGAEVRVSFYDQHFDQHSPKRP